MKAGDAAINIHLSALNVLDEAKAIRAAIADGRSAPRNVEFLRSFIRDLEWGLAQLEAAPVVEESAASLPQAAE